VTSNHIHEAAFGADVNILPVPSVAPMRLAGLRCNEVMAAASALSHRHARLRV
jgi:hypothetical protein